MRPFLKAIGNTLKRQTCIRLPNRTYLSNAFSCSETWESRLNHKIFQQINSEAMYYDLDGAYNRNKKLAAVDVDVFVNSQKDDSFIVEVEELLYKLRSTEQTGATLPTTHHAVIRLFLKCRRVEDLVRILYDRLNYGIFPDYYCTMLLLDHFLKANDFRHAAKIGALDMFQEDYSHTLARHMSLFAIHKYLLTDQLWDDPVPPPVENEEEEEIKVRVQWIRNPFFDNHFDLVDGKHICGKSLLMISSKLEGPMRQSYKLMGLALFNLWDKLEAELVNLISHVKNQSSPTLYADAVEFTLSSVKDDLVDSEKQQKITELLKQIDSKSCIQDSLLTTVENEMKKLIEEHEKNEIRSQEKLYKDWETLRENTLAAFLEEMRRRKRLDEVERKKLELEEEEELMYFFENEDEIDKIVEIKQMKLSKRRQAESKDDTEDSYVPPEVHRRITNNTGK